MKKINLICINFQNGQEKGFWRDKEKYLLLVWYYDNANQISKTSVKVLFITEAFDSFNLQT